ncbi:MAG: hypothetical protein IPJ88_17440 [Myxococcales bacterium]|nr:MAG: hypothetical protein IPJ88_17440 [Myxococcales bacterium]
MSHSRFIELLKKKKRRIIGLMSGMSMDGIDLSLASFDRSKSELHIELEDSFSCPTPKTYGKRCVAASNKDQAVNYAN